MNVQTKYWENGHPLASDPVVQYLAIRESQYRALVLALMRSLTNEPACADLLEALGQTRVAIERLKQIQEVVA